MSESSDREPLREENQPASGAAPPESSSQDGTFEGAPTRALTPGNVAKLALGGTLLAADSVDERLQRSLRQGPHGESTQEPDSAIPSDLPARESVLIPQEQWGAVFGESAGQQTRYMMIGMAAESRDAASKGLGKVLRASNRLGIFLARVLKPVTNSKLLSPVRGGFDSLEKRGESRVSRWIERGRLTEAHSRAVAESTVNQLVDNSMDDLVESPRVQLFVQEIVEAQSMGLAGEGINELRERTVSSDMFVEARARTLFRRTPRALLPDPPFRERLLRHGALELDPLHMPGLRGQYAGFTSRLFAFLLDLVLVTIGLTVAGWLISAVLDLFKMEEALRIVAGFVSSGVIATILFFGYFAIAWMATGQTLGMLILGIRVVGPEGGYPSFWQSLRRVIGYFIAALIFFLGFVWIIVDDRRQGWHDKIGSTFVVYSWDARPDETFLRERPRTIRQQRHVTPDANQEGSAGRS